MSYHSLDSQVSSCADVSSSCSQRSTSCLACASDPNCYFCAVDDSCRSRFSLSQPCSNIGYVITDVAACATAPHCLSKLTCDACLASSGCSWCFTSGPPSSLQCVPSANTSLLCSSAPVLFFILKRS